MKKAQKAILIILLITCTVFLFSACGDKDKYNSDDYDSYNSYDSSDSNYNSSNSDDEWSQENIDRIASALADEIEFD